MTSQKNATITYTKAVGIILMVLGHSGCSVPFVVPFIYMFHMPLFFFASGYCFKPQYLESPFAFLWKRIKRIYWPFVKWGVFFVIIHNLLFRLNILNDQYGFMGKVAHLYSVEEIKHIVWMMLTRMHNTEQLIGGFWFLNALFFGSIISWGVLKLFRNITLSVAVLFAACLILNHTHYIIPHLNLSTQAFAASFVFVSGYWACQHKIRIFKGWQIILVAALTFCGSFMYQINFGEWFYDNSLFVPYIVTSVFATWGVYSLFAYYKGKTNRPFLLLNHIGNHTIQILTWHFLSFKLVSLLIIGLYDLPFKRIAEVPVITEYAIRGWWILYFIIGLAVPLLGIYITRNTINYSKKIILCDRQRAKATSNC